MWIDEDRSNGQRPRMASCNLTMGLTSKDGKLKRVGWACISGVLTEENEGSTMRLVINRTMDHD